jgi:hypothetical protein
MGKGKAGIEGFVRVSFLAVGKDPSRRNKSLFMELL